MSTYMNVTLIIGSVLNIMKSVKSSDDTDMHNNVFTFFINTKTQKTILKNTCICDPNIITEFSDMSSVARRWQNYALIVP